MRRTQPLPLFAAEFPVGLGSQDPPQPEVKTPECLVKIVRLGYGQPILALSEAHLRQLSPD
jgi:hypothetical protein